MTSPAYLTYILPILAHLLKRIALGLYFFRFYILLANSPYTVYSHTELSLQLRHDALETGNFHYNS